MLLFRVTVAWSISGFAQFAESTAVVPTLMLVYFNSLPTWDNHSKSVELDSPNLKIKGKMGGSSVEVNEKEITTDTSFDLINGTVMVPILWIAEGLDAKWSYDKNTHVLSIKHKLFLK